jgi:hypothetical protein
MITTYRGIMGLALKLIEKIQTSIPSRYSSNPNAMQMIRDEIKNMEWEISQSEKGTRSGRYDVNTENGKGYLSYTNTSTKSTFPSYLQGIFGGSGTAKKFFDAVKKGQGAIWDKIALEAIDRLENGYKNHHGYDHPNQDFIDIIKNPIPF